MKKTLWLILVVSVLVVATVVGGVLYLSRGTTGANATGDSSKPLWTELPSRGADAVTTVDTGSFVRLAEALSPAVVHIAVSKRVRGDGGADYYPFGSYGQPSDLVQQGLGTGLVVNADGHILTNNHVIEGASEITVKLVDNKEYPAVVLGADPRTDLALLKINADEPLVPAPLGDSDALKIGEWVLAIGNPFGLDHTVTAGIVSAKGRKEVTPDPRNRYADFIQTDASINPGNSGGPLVNMRGEVVGINSALAAGQGIGFAIPVNMAKTLIPQLARGRVHRSYLGVQIQPVTAEIARSLRMPQARGALVADVVARSPADQAGIEAGDVITAFDGNEITDADDLPWLAASAGIGKQVDVELLRAGKSRTMQVTLAANPDDVPASPRGPSGGSPIPSIGMAVAPVPDEVRSTERIPEGLGVLVSSVDRRGPAWYAGVRPGDIVLRLGYIPITSPSQLAAICDKSDPGDSLPLHLRRTGRLLWVAVERE